MRHRRWAVPMKRKAFRLNRTKCVFRQIAVKGAAYVLVIVGSAPGFCQSDATPPAFEVTSVKVSTPASAPGGGCLPLLVGCRRGSQWVATNGRLQWIIEDAYKLNDTQIVGLPRWADTARFDIEAKVGPEITDTQFRLMEQALLADRFHLVAHRATRDLPAYTLRAAMGGAKLQLSSGPCTREGSATVAGAPTEQPPPCGRQGLIQGRSKSGELTGSTALTFRNISMRELVSYLEFRFDSESLPVVDETGLSGLFDLNLTFRVGPPVANDRAAYDDYNVELLLQMQKAFREQVGLDLNLLQPTKRSVSILVVDSVSMPSAN